MSKSPSHHCLFCGLVAHAIVERLPRFVPGVGPEASKVIHVDAPCLAEIRRQRELYHICYAPESYDRKAVMS